MIETQIRVLGELTLPTQERDALVYHNNILRELHEAVRGLQSSLYTVRHVVPSKPREGMICLADGTDWDPGSGAGLYHYLGAAWNKL
jgi:hypothetical protein